MWQSARDAPLAFFEKRVQVVGQRLRLGRIAAAHARGGAFMHGREAVAPILVGDENPIGRVDVIALPSGNAFVCFGL